MTIAYRVLVTVPDGTPVEVKVERWNDRRRRHRHAAPLQERVGLVGELVEDRSNRSRLTQVLTIALLVIIAIPAYVFWRAMNDAHRC